MAKALAKAPPIYTVVLRGQGKTNLPPKIAKCVKVENVRPTDVILEFDNRPIQSEVHETMTDKAWLYNEKLRKLRGRWRRNMKKLHFQSNTVAPAFRAWFVTDLAKQKLLHERVENGELVELRK